MAVAYVVDSSLLQAGSIVKIEKPFSSTGKPTYPHYFIILNVPPMLKAGDTILLVGISSGIPREFLDPARHIAMKWLGRRGGDPETGLTCRCHACIDFTHMLEVYSGHNSAPEIAAEFAGKFVRADKLKAIVAAMDAWIRRK